MGTKGKEATSIVAIIKAAQAAKSAPEKEPFQKGTTYNQYVVRSTGEGHATFTPGRDWTDLKGEDAVICYKSLASAIAATAQEQVAHQVQGAYFAWLDSVPLAEQVANGTKGFGAHDRAFEVAMTPEITTMIAAAVSFSGEEHVAFFRGKTERRKAERSAYRTLSDPAIAKIIEVIKGLG